ncbi:MAG: glucose PTS transporter subunit IIA [Clostridiales bacterium]|nr:glucose PTS transporter subunit IIA [Clostridiales bacterium]
MKDKIFGVFQRIGRSFMLPIAILPVAGLFLGIGSSLTSAEMLKAYGLYEAMGPGTIPYAFFTVLNKAGDIVFANLPILFAMGVAIGMAKKEKEVAALSGAIAFFIMHATIGALISYQYTQYDEVTGEVIMSGVDALNQIRQGSATFVVGIGSLQMGVFGGILVGLGVAALHNRFYKIQLPQVLSFFGGTRFVPIISSIVYLFVGILMFFVWPFIQSGISAVGNLVMQSGYAGTFLYGLMERALIPFGLHHVFYLPFWQTSMGGTMEVAGRVVEGAQNIFFAQLAAGVDSFSVEATRFMSGKFPLMIFGLPGAALAMYRCAKPEKRKIAGSLLLSAGLTAMLTGITEPIEFTFLFVAPILYVIHCVFAGLAYMLMHVFNVGVGMTFSGGIIDLTLFGILQGNAKTNWIWVVIVGIGYFVVYYILFSVLIKKLNLKTPGREDDTEETKLYTRADVNAKKAGEGTAAAQAAGSDPTSALILQGLGGKDNLSDVDCCATRLRVTVHDPSKVDKGMLTQSGAAGVIFKGNGVQVIYGPRVTVIKSKLEDYIASGASDVVAVGQAPAAAAQESAKEEKSGPSTTVVYVPIKGKAIPLSEVADEVFSSGMLGEGAAIEPAEGRAVAPVTGTVEAVFDTKHAIGLKSDDGVEVLIHIGLDTVKLEGKYYDVKVKVGDRVTVGDLLVTFDIPSIKKAGYPVVTPVIISNTADYQQIKKAASGTVQETDALIVLTK